MKRSQQSKLNCDIQRYMDTEVIAQEPCLIAIVSWLQENALGYFDEEDQFQTEKEDESCQPDCKLTRYWIYSHHIYSKVDVIYPMYILENIF